MIYNSGWLQLACSAARRASAGCSRRATTARSAGSAASSWSTAVSSAVPSAKYPLLTQDRPEAKSHLLFVTTPEMQGGDYQAIMRSNPFRSNRNSFYFYSCAAVAEYVEAETSYHCVICGEVHESLNLLRRHLSNVHRQQFWYPRPHAARSASITVAVSLASSGSSRTACCRPTSSRATSPKPASCCSTTPSATSARAGSTTSTPSACTCA